MDTDTSNAAADAAAQSDTADAPGSAVQVEIYSTPTCHFCHMAKDFFTENGVSYVDYDVAQDAAKRDEMVQMTGQMGVPVIKIGDTEAIVGFNEAKVKELLGMDA